MTQKTVNKYLKWLFLTPLFLLMGLVALVFLYFVYCEVNKAYWDRKVKEWCEKDGGVTVFEHVELTKEEYEKNDDKNGFIQVWSERTSPENHDYADKSIRNEINTSNPEVWRSEYITYRKSDGKYLGKWVTYARRGGDVPTGISHPSSFSCRDIPNFDSNSTAKIFSIKGW